MNYFKVNYDRLMNLRKKNYFIIVIILILLLSTLIVASFFINISSTLNLVGVYNDETLKININNKLSDILKRNDKIICNGKISLYHIKDYGEYEIINNEVYQTINLTVDKSFMNNEVVNFEIHYDNEKLINYIFKLFK